MRDHQEASAAVTAEAVEPVPAAEGRIGRLRRLAVDGLSRMFNPERGLYCFRVRPGGAGVRQGGVSRRYTAICLLGLAGETEETREIALAGTATAHVLETMIAECGDSENLGDLALALWAAQAHGHPGRNALWRRLESLDPLGAPHAAVEIAWALDAALGEGAARAALATQLAARLLAAEHAAGVFPHRIGGPAAGPRGHVACFADFVYPIHALANYGTTAGHEGALAAATRAAQRICRLQGREGQWWWHYDVRTGDVVEGYPVYSVHQDAMAPMALFALADASGSDFDGNVERGLRWIYRAAEMSAPLVDEERSVVWRKVGRAEPGKLVRYAQALTSRAHPRWRLPAADRLFPPRRIDFECRPYHLGWLLYAWPEDRARRWDERRPGGVE
ncbi:MAG: hypothetical protein GWN84_26560 [Gammaproteobacteria bacterium]|nr:hypothetical protein [Gammaproteobacteria bacterium]NIR85958.1 hypothetical protein [Gammaproteobacteria bacterium]NIU06410.1 hypothetical protein [Gammaproteobacteria bacterium]NIV53304.1 hypothetical protein [Gammaproteobacteria bacterium]NIV76961.1 hypothetical protein [Gammaproteobacteria bacterium]